jgi:hypothetical protein
MLSWLVRIEYRFLSLFVCNLYKLIPLSGYPKELRVEFEILGRSYTEVRTDDYGHLSKALFVESSSITSPTIPYGYTTHKCVYF